MEGKKKKYRLLITASTFPRWEGDTEPRFILDLAKSLLPYFHVTVLAPSAPGAARKELLEGVQVIRYRYFPLRRLETLCSPGAILARVREKKTRALLIPFLFLGLWWKLLRTQRNYDVIQANWLIPQGIVQSMFRKPYVLTGHGSDITGLNGGPVLSLKRRCIRKAGAVTVVSSQLKREVERICPGKEVLVCSLGYNRGQFSPSFHRENGFGQGSQKAVLFVGRLAEEKGISYLIEAMRELPDANLYLVGEGTLRAQLEQEAKGMENRIFFLGGKTHEELKVLYASADVLAVPSLREGLGLVILEAMGSGLPVAATRVGGIPDLVRDGENGFLVSPADPHGMAEALRRLLSLKPEQYQAFQNSALKTAAGYDYTEVGRRYGKILEAVRQKGRSR